MATKEYLEAKIKTLEEELAGVRSEVSEAYMDGVKAAREFDAEMDAFLVNFLRKPYSSIVIFAIAGGLLSFGILIGTLL